jgi:hypothetical protein
LVTSQKNWVAKFFSPVEPGNRIFPPKSKDRLLEVRYDAGHFDGPFRTVYLQVNSQAKSTALKKWLAKQGSKGTHANLATGQIDTQAVDKDAEAQRLLEDLNKQVDEKIG